LKRICGAYETHILCLTHPFSKSYGFHETHSVPDTPLQQVVWCSWNTLCAWHTLATSRVVLL